ncbi:DNA-binding protein YbiB [Inhella sp.]|uniref:DNA-binding protein YbiB n=1 Tax=Inhella sp. TaxID=1921806 RepID=UPI0035AE2ACC
MSTLDLPSLIKHIGRGARGAGDLSREQAAALFGAMLDGEVPELQLGAIVLALRMKGEAVAELQGFADALQTRTQPLRLPAGPRTVLLPSLNGSRKLLNLMPLLAMHLAQGGVPVLVHGRNDFGAARGDSFALLAALGHPVCQSLAEASERLQARRLAVLPSRLLCPGLDALMALRPRLGLRNAAHTLAKLLTPDAARTVRVAAVTHGDFEQRLTELLSARTGAESGAALLLKGCEGESYPHPRRASSLQAWCNGQALTLPAKEPEDAELQPSVPNPEADAQALQTLLRTGPSAWPARLREMAEALHMLSSNM